MTARCNHTALFQQQYKANDGPVSGAGFC